MSEESESDDGQRIRDAAEWLARDLASPPDVAELCERVGLTQYQLRAGFRHKFQSTPGAWLRLQRMERAARLLDETDETIAGIAFSVGYRNASRFADAFRRQHGVPPAEYRSRFRDR